MNSYWLDDRTETTSYPMVAQGGEPFLGIFRTRGRCAPLARSAGRPVNLRKTPVARSVVNGRETVIVTFGPGEFFGDLALFDHGPRSADVVARLDSILLRMSALAFQRLTREAPALATPFLQATARTMAARIRADNQRLTRLAQQYSAGPSLR